MKKKPNGYWTYERCKKVALICKNRNELDERYRGAYKAIYKNKWIELFGHMKILKKPDNYWTYEKCKEYSLLCNSKKELNNNYSGASITIHKNKWIELISHFKILKLPNGYWTYEKCKEEALKYKYISEMQKSSPTSYSKILKNKWLDLFEHMERIGNKVMRLIYVYEFNDNHCYIGLTGNIKRRNNQHFGKEKGNDSSVYKHILQTNITPTLILKSDYICVDDAILLEEKILKEYKINGWIILNQIKTGGIGSNDIKWNKKTCREEAKKYKNASHFNRQGGGAYNAASKYNWLDEFFPKTSKNGYWNDIDLCREEAKKYKNRSEFCYGSWSAYNYSNINKWLDEFFSIR